MPDITWKVITEVADRDDAVALMDLIRELGYQSSISGRQVGYERGPTSETRAGRLILRNMTLGRSFSLDDIGAWLLAKEFSPRTASPLLGLLVHENKVERIAPGIYRKIPNGEKHD